MIFSKACCTPFPGHITGNRRIVGLARNLIDLVNVDDAALRPFDIIVRGLQQLQNDVLDILADIAGFGEGRCIGHGERHINDARQRLGQQRLPAPGGADQQNIRLRQFDVAILLAMGQALVVIVDSNRENFLRVLLTNHIVVKNFLNISRRWNATVVLDKSGFIFFPR